VPHDPYALPDFISWPTFPFEGDMRVKDLEDPVEVEPARQGEDPEECSACRAPDSAYIWISQRWRVRALDRPSGLPMVLILESRSHLDLGDLPNLLAAELGVMTVRLERAIRSIEGVARVHINRWGDGSAHLHLWFLARPYGRLQLRGTFLSLWDDILPPIAEPSWRGNLALVAAWLAEFGGRPLAEPPPMDWKAPTSFDERVESTVEGPVDLGAPPVSAPAPEVAWDREDVVHVPAHDPSSAATADPSGDNAAADTPTAAGTAEELPSASTTDDPSAADGPNTADAPGAGTEPRNGPRTAEALGTSETAYDAGDPVATTQMDAVKEAPEGGAAPARRRSKAATSPRSTRGGRRPLAPDPADPEEAWEEGV
jgi:hypothetical protein